MKNLNQNDLEYLQDLLNRGIITADQANVEMVKMARVKVIINSLPSGVRKALNSAGKSRRIETQRQKRTQAGSILSSRLRTPGKRRA